MIMLFGLVKDPYISILEAENKQMRKELADIRRKEFLTEITKTFSPTSDLGSLLGGGGTVKKLPPLIEALNL